jgi:adenylate cyclase
VKVYSFSGTSTVAFRPSLPIPDKPSIAVLPFDNMSADFNDEFLADGIVEEIIAALSRVRSFFVIARNSTHLQGTCGECPTREPGVGRPLRA